MGKIDDYSVGTVNGGDRLLASNTSTGETKNITVDALSESINGDSSWNTVIVNVSSAELLAINTTPKTILAAPGAGKYHEYEARAEYDYNTVAYTVSGGGSLYLNQGSKDCYFPQTMISQTENTAAVGTNYGFHKMNTAITLTSDANPTSGNGTFRIILRYRVRTFGE
jgi:hypothetical protein